MSSASAQMRIGLAWLLVTCAAISTSAAAPAQAAEATFTATTSVNIRSGASTSNTVLRQLQVGESVVAAGKKSGSWLPIRYSGKTAYVWASYLKADKVPAPVVTLGPSGLRTATSNLALLAEPAKQADPVADVAQGEQIRVSGRIAGEFTQVILDAGYAWALTESVSREPETPKAEATYRTTARLALRTGPQITAKNQVTIPAKAKVAITGSHSASYSQVLYKGKQGWVITGLATAVAGTAAHLILPVSKGVRYVTEPGAVLRDAPDASASQVATLDSGAALRITGNFQNQFTEVIWDGGRRWVADASVSTTKQPTSDLGSSSLNKLQPAAKAAVVELRTLFDQVKTIYGWRSSSVYSGDHPAGRAIDVMIPSYEANVALGDAIAEWAISNADRLKVNYVIWRQRIFTIARGSWVKMSDRGGDTANHFDHVHVSFFDS